MTKRLYKSECRTLCGVCGGIADYFNLDPTIVRLLWVVMSCLSAGTGIVAYIICALVIPNRPSSEEGWDNAPRSEGERAADREFNSHFEG